MRQLVLILMALIAACAASPEFIQVSEDTYLIKRSDQGGIFGNSVEMRRDVLRQADEFAAEKGMVAEEVVLSETPVGIGRFAKIEYTFRLVDPEISTDSREPEEYKDVYTELVKFDDLHERGILSDEEFAEQKRKILESN